MTIPRAAFRIAALAVVIFILFACGVVNLLGPALRTASPTTGALNATAWGLLAVVWLGIAGAGLLVRRGDPTRGTGLLLAAGAIPCLFALYWLLISVAAAMQ